MVGFLTSVYHYWGGRFNLLKENFIKYKLCVDNELPSEFSWHNYLANRLIYGVSPEEYNVYKFYELDDSRKREWVTNVARFKYYKKMNGMIDVPLFLDKYETYLLLKKYYKRNVVKCFSKNDEKELKLLMDFINDNETFVIKPNNACCGVGVELIERRSFDNDDALIAYLKTKGEMIAEQLIVQSGVFYDLHPQSCNTIRVPAFRTKNGIKIHRPFMKVGVNESMIDNGMAGGILVSIDSNSGVTNSIGVDEYGNRYEKHPNSGIKFEGIALPEWNEVINIVNKMMMKVDGVKYVGWDLAYSIDGWVVVEGNDGGQFVGQQMTVMSGCRKEVESLIKEM